MVGSDVFPIEIVPFSGHAFVFRGVGVIQIHWGKPLLKCTLRLKGNYYWRYTHISPNQDDGRKGIALVGFRWMYGLCTYLDEWLIFMGCVSPDGMKGTKNTD